MMNWKEEYKPFLWISGFFLFAYFIPVSSPDFKNAVYSAFELTGWYAREHVIFCLIPAFFIAGVIAVFVSQAAVIKYFGAGAKRWLSYAVASVSGTILAVCSCTILPLFSGIYRRGAGLGPAMAFLYSGPAINILAIILTARILGLEMGIARAIGSVTFSVVIGLIMHMIYRNEESARSEAQIASGLPEERRPLWQTALHFFVLVAILVFVNWGKPDSQQGLWNFLFTQKWMITSVLGILFAGSLLFILKLNKIRVITGGLFVIIAIIIRPENPLIPFIITVVALSILLSMDKGEGNEWLDESWGFAKQILPLLAAGALIAGFLLGTPEGGRGIIPDTWIASLVGGNSVFANLFASMAGAFMYFASAAYSARRKQ